MHPGFSNALVERHQKLVGPKRYLLKVRLCGAMHCGLFLYYICDLLFRMFGWQQVYSVHFLLACGFGVVGPMMMQTFLDGIGCMMM
jgi:hypothetical protein